MRKTRFARGEAGLPEASQRVVRPLRLATGLILFAYATCHLINHAFGIRSIVAMEAARRVLLHPWQTSPGLTVLYSAFLIHATLGLYALYRRRHLRMPASEGTQLLLGLAIPLLLIPHAAVIRLGESLYGLEFGYARVLYQYWFFGTDASLLRQFLLLLVLWIHGCIGIRAWLRSKAWYARAAAPLASLALLVPVLALIGFVNAGADIRDATQRDPQSAAAFAIAEPGTPADANLQTARWTADRLSLAYLGLLAGTIGLRALRDWHARRFRAVRITYPGGRVVTVPPGFSVLEASRWAGIAHASICGGRGRCSTCRIRVVAGADGLPSPGPIERRTLDRIGAPARVRLACQVRPQADIEVEPLVRADAAALAGAARFDAAIAGGREMEIAALFVDLRESTKLAAGRLPYDALFLFDRYVQVITAAVRENGGHVTSIAGDGVMTMFATEQSRAAAARDAFKAALQLWAGIDRLNRELADELQAPLRIGVGLHVGVAVVGMVASADAGSLQFLGDTGNVAAKLEVETKTFDCTLIASAEAVSLIAPRRDDLTTIAVPIPGKDVFSAVLFRDRSELEQLLSAVAHSPVGLDR
jgi:adenylate cyclase